MVQSLGSGSSMALWLSSRYPVAGVIIAGDGIGYETVLALTKSGNPYSIILGGRTLSKVTSAIESLKLAVPDTQSSFSAVQIDVTDNASISAAVKTVKAKHEHIDTLINNASTAFDPDPNQCKISRRQARNQAGDVNVTGAEIVTHEFATLLLNSSTPRLVFLTLGTASLVATEDDTYPLVNTASDAGWPKNDTGIEANTYCSSKVDSIMMTREWERRFRKDGVKVFIVSPGWLATGVGGQGEEGRLTMLKMGAEDPSLGGEFLRDIIQGARDSDAGKVIKRDGLQQW